MLSQLELRNNKGQFVKGAPSFKPRIIKSCLVCSKEFYARKSNIERGKAKYCSQQCAWSHNHLRFKRSDIVCLLCNRKFYPKSATQRYCSVSCVNTSKRGKSINSKHILTSEQREAISQRQIERFKHTSPWNKGLKGYNAGSKHPNWGKTFEHMRGENNPNWKGGKKHDRRYDNNYRIWRSRVFARDNYTCQICDQYGGYLQADHIKSYAEYTDLRYDIDNGRTLCMACHYYVTYKKKMPKGIVWGVSSNKRIVRF